MKVTLVAGARPNFVKIAPIVRELRKRGASFRWVHTGQHHGAMSDPFLRELELPDPDTRLDAHGSHAETVAACMVGVETELVNHRPDWLVVVGDADRDARLETGRRAEGAALREPASRSVRPRSGALDDRGQVVARGVRGRAFGRLAR